MIAEIIELEPEEVTDEAHLVQELGADSMTVLELMAALNSAYGIDINPEYLPRLTSLRDVIAVLDEIMADNID